MGREGGEEQEMVVVVGRRGREEAGGRCVRGWVVCVCVCVCESECACACAADTYEGLPREGRRRGR